MSLHTVEAAHIQSHTGLLLNGDPLELCRGEGAGSPRAQSLQEAVLAHSLEAILPIIRHKPGGGTGSGSLLCRLRLALSAKVRWKSLRQTHKRERLESTLTGSHSLEC